MMICVIASIVLSCLFKFVPLLSLVPDGFVIIISALSVSVVLALLFPIPEQDVEKEEEVLEL